MPALPPGALVARPDYAEENPELVARFSPSTCVAGHWPRRNPEQAREMLVDFCSDDGVEISDAAVEAEFDLRPTFGLEEQLAILDRSDGNSDVDAWLTEIGAFMADVGTLDANPEPGDYIEPSFMQR
jgi:ABC-type nitrate/sulfonate/bicarbonate transport system substrate-binding protein